MATKAALIAGHGVVTLATDQTALEKGLAAASEKFKAWGKTIGLMGAGIAAAGASIMAPFLHGLNVASEWGNELISANRRTGISFESLGSLAYALRLDMDGLSMAVRTMDGLMEQAISNPASEAAQRISALGLSIESLQRMSQDNRLRSFAGALGAIGDQGERIAAARHAFGREGANADVSGGAAGIAGREQHGRAIGAVMPTETLQTILRYNTAMREMGIITRAAWAQMGELIAPFMTGLVTQLTIAIQGLRAWINEHRALVTIIFYVGAALTVLGTAITIIGSAIWIAGGAFAAFRGAMAGAWAMATTLGGALALIQYGAMIVGLGSVSMAFFGLRVAMYSYHAAMFLVHAATWAYAAALGVFQGVMMAVQGTALSFMGVTAASRAVIFGHTAAMYVAAAAMWVYHAALWAVTTGLGTLTVLNSLWAVGNAANNAIAAAATWLYAVAVAALEVTLWALGAAYTWCTTAEIAFFSSEMLAWVGETLLTAGTNLLVFALVALEGTLIIVTGGLAIFAAGVGVVALGLAALGIRFGQFSDRLQFIDDAVDSIVGFIQAIPRAIADAWNYLIVSPVVTFVHGVMDAFESLRNTVVRTWNSISDAIDQANNGGLGEFMSDIGYVVVGAIALGGALAYVAYRITSIENTVASLMAIWNDIFSGGLIEQIRAIADQIAAPFISAFNSITSLWNGIGAWFAETFGAIGTAVQGVMMWLASPFISAYQWVIDAWAGLGDYIVAQLIAPFVGLRALLEQQIAGMMAMIAYQFRALVFVVNIVVGQITGAFGGLWQQLATLGRALVNTMTTTFFRIAGAGRDMLSGVWTAFAANFASTVSSIAATAADAAGRIWTSFSRVFNTLTADVRRVWAGIVNAFNVGDWSLIWEILQAAALVAWDEIKQAGREIWVEVRYSALSIFADIQGYLKDAFAGAFLAIQTNMNLIMGLFESGWITALGKIEAAFWKFVAKTGQAIIDMQSIFGYLNPANVLIGQHIATATENVGRAENMSTGNANAARDRAGTANTALTENEDVRWLLDRDVRRQNQADLAAARDAERAAVARGNPADIAAARGRREMLDYQLDHARFLREYQDAMGIAADGAGDFGRLAGGASIHGAYSAQAIFGLPGAGLVTPEPPALRAAREAREQAQRQEEAARDRHLEIVRLTQRLIEVAGVTFG